VCRLGDKQPQAVVEGLSGLLDKQLLTRIVGRHGEERVGMLETIHEYARERLERSGEAEALCRHHAAYYLALAEQAAPELRGPQQQAWLARLEAEHSNLRAVLQWAAAHEETELELRLAGVLGRFWYTHGHFREGRQWLAAALAEGRPQSALLRAQALLAAGTLAQAQSDYGAAHLLLEESLVLWRDLGNHRGMANALANLGLIAADQGEAGRATALLEESLTLHWEVGDRYNIAEDLERLAAVASTMGQFDRGVRLWSAAAALRDIIGTPLPPVERVRYDCYIAAAQRHLSEAAFAAAWAEGGAMPLEQAIAYALDDTHG
jgi:tetratricopeptide (TPR) repeat protein